ncbi:MAG: phosphatidylserine decarboxylase [Phycisphaerae bacterium]
MAKYALLEVLLITLIGGGATIAALVWLGPWSLIPGVLTILLLQFYRDPPRWTPEGDNLLISPADGRIMSVERNWQPPGGGAAELRICIFLNVFNVHVNRAPCAGEVAAIDYSPGLFLNAMNPEATLKNENNLVTMMPTGPIPGPIRVRQISGLLAKRIVCELQVGDRVAAGERFGMIKLGSQTEIRVPEDARWKVSVAVGQKVYGGATVLASIE